MTTTRRNNMGSVTNLNERVQSDYNENGSRKSGRKPGSTPILWNEARARKTGIHMHPDVLAAITGQVFKVSITEKGLMLTAVESMGSQKLDIPWREQQSA